jgi:monoamine oxidase
MNKHIGIVGAGFAGMAAALELHDLDYKVTVIEARQRVGGRIWSTRLSNGEVVELGGEWIGSQDKHILGIVDRLGLSKVGVGVNFLQRKVIAGDPVSIEEQQAAREVARITLAVMNKEDIAASSIGNFINNLPLSAVQRKYFYSRVQISYGTDPKNVALRMMEHYAPPSHNSDSEFDGYYRVASGNMSVTQSISGRLEDIRLDHEVSLVEYHENKVIVWGTSAGEPFQVALDGLVLAVPVKILAQIEFNPRLPFPIQNAIESVSMGTAAKFAVATREEPALRAYHDVETPYWCWTGNGADGNVRRVLTAFSGSAKSLKELGTESNNPAIWLQKIKSVNQDLDFTGDPLMVDWSQDKWAGGCYSAFSNQAADNISELTISVGNLFFAGEHAAYNSATMDGAIESGLRAANQVREQLR